MTNESIYQSKKYSEMYGKNKILITSALPYVNNIPHLGNIVGCVLSGDVYARYMRKKQFEVLFVGGVDEYGTATEMKAREENISCKKLCDKNYKLHTDIYNWFDISFDCYGRTSQPNGDPSIIDNNWSHTTITQNIYLNLVKNNYICEKEENIIYCHEINSVIADRFIVGVCPICSYDKANGDQCDKCGKLLDAVDLINPKYKINPEYTLSKTTTKNLYLDIPKIWNDFNFNQWINKNSENWTHNSIMITKQWINNGLESRSITRDLYWGTRVPDTDIYKDKYKNKVFYVWFDAPIGYISITENKLGKELSEKWWRNNDVKIVQFMAKDNVPFHSIIFPATLRGSNYSDISDLTIISTEYLMYEGGKFSKSNKTGLFCDDVISLSNKHNLLADYWRAYLIFIRPEKKDSDFRLNGEGSFVEFINNILISNIGNLVNRTLSLSYKLYIKIKDDTDFMYKFNELNIYDEFIEEYDQNMMNYKLSDGFKTILKLGNFINGYIFNNAPWKLLSENNLIQCCDVLYNILIGINILSDLLEPFMPKFSNMIKYECNSNNYKNYNFIKTQKPTILIKEIDKL